MRAKRSIITVRITGYFMKKRIDFILYYLCILIAGCFCATFVYVQYIGCTHFVTGNMFHPAKEIVLAAFFQSVPLVLLCVPLLLAVYKIRHLYNPVWSVISFALMCAFSWGILYPLAETGKKSACGNGSILLNTGEIPLSGGYFRKSAEAVYYFTDESENKTADVMLLHSPENPDKSGGFVKLDVSENSDFYKNAFPFRDSCVKESLNDIPYEIIGCIDNILKAAEDAWQNGIVAWACFCSLCLALASSYSYIKMSTWRMVNYLAVVLTNMIILVFNSLYYSGFAGMRTFLKNALYGNGRLAFFSSRNIDIPLCILNVAAAVAVICIGCSVTAVTKRRQQDRGGYES